MIVETLLVLALIACLVWLLVPRVRLTPAERMAKRMQSMGVPLGRRDCAALFREREQPRVEPSAAPSSTL